MEALEKYGCGVPEKGKSVTKAPEEKPNVDTEAEEPARSIWLRRLTGLFPFMPVVN